MLKDSVLDYFKFRQIMGLVYVNKIIKEMSLDYVEVYAQLLIHIGVLNKMLVNVIKVIISKYQPLIVSLFINNVPKIKYRLMEIVSVM